MIQPTGKAGWTDYFNGECMNERRMEISTVRRIKKEPGHEPVFHEQDPAAGPIREFSRSSTAIGVH